MIGVLQSERDSILRYVQGNQRRLHLLSEAMTPYHKWELNGLVHFCYILKMHENFTKFDPDKLMKFFTPLLVASTAFGATLSAQAQSDFYRRSIPSHISEGGYVGAVLLAEREYRGSDEPRVRLLPSFDYQWSNGFFAGLPNGFGYNASTRSDIAYGVRVTAEFGRREKRSPALRGLGDIPAQPELGAFFNYSPTSRVTLSSSLRSGSGNDRKGLLLDLGARWGADITPSLGFSSSVATTWANTDYLQDYFGVTAAQASSSGYGVYRPESGLRDVRVGATLIYRLDQTWALTATLNRSQLLNDAKTSPIVREQGSTTAFFTVGYLF